MLPGPEFLKRKAEEKQVFFRFNISSVTQAVG